MWCLRCRISEFLSIFWHWWKPWWLRWSRPTAAPPCGPSSGLLSRIDQTRSASEQAAAASVYFRPTWRDCFRVCGVQALAFRLWFLRSRLLRHDEGWVRRKHCRRDHRVVCWETSQRQTKTTRSFLSIFLIIKWFLLGLGGRIKKRWLGRSLLTSGLDCPHL